jgi:hypothetical protein
MKLSSVAFCIPDDRFCFSLHSKLALGLLLSCASWLFTFLHPSNGVRNPVCADFTASYLAKHLSRLLPVDTIPGEVSLICPVFI